MGTTIEGLEDSSLETKICYGCNNNLPIRKFPLRFKRGKYFREGRCNTCKKRSVSRARARKQIREELRGTKAQARAVMVMAERDPYVLNLVYRSNPEGFKEALQIARFQVFDEIKRRYIHYGRGKIKPGYDQEGVFREIAEEFNIPYERREI